MIKLSKALNVWNTAVFRDVLKKEIEALDGNLLPLQQGLSRSSHAITEGFSVMLISVADEPEQIRVVAGISYRGMIPGCSCADDPTPVDEVPEYCEVRFDIDKKTAATTVTLLTE